MMASSMMHLAIAHEITNKITIDDNNRFYIGSILPDAAVNSNSHFRTQLKNHKNAMNTELFYQQFNDRLPYDGLYLGYYFHLIEDIIFRNVLYVDLKLMKYRGDSNFVNDLHMDYWILNNYLVKKYNLANNLSVPKRFEQERIQIISNYDIEEFLSNCNNQFIVNTNKKPKYFLEKDVDSYINKCVEICLFEYSSLNKGKTSFNHEYYAW